MRKGSDILGKTVVALDTGAKLETVSDLIFDQNNNQLLALLVDDGGWFSEARVLPLNAVQTIGPDAVLTPSKSAIVEAPRLPAVQRILQNNNILKGTTVMTTDGRDLGKLVDLFFDEQTGQIEGFEVSGGIFADAATGRSFVPATHTFKIGEDAAFVPPEVASMMEAQDAGGIKGALDKAGDKIKQGANQARAAATDAMIDPQQQRAFALGKTAQDNVYGEDNRLIVGAGQVVTEQTLDLAQQHNVLDSVYRATGGSVTDHVRDEATAAVGVEQARGRRVAYTVRTNEGYIVAAQGQIVTDAVVDRAKRYDKEHELLVATGLAPETAARNQASGTANATGDRIAEGAQDVKEGASNLWDKLKEKVSDAQERTAQQIEEERIEHALGRPVTRVILDRQDNVILNTGEIITHKAVNEARQADVLGVLLSSVFDQEPPLAPEATLAPQQGRASLEQQHPSDENQHSAG